MNVSWDFFERSLILLLCVSLLDLEEHLRPADLVAGNRSMASDQGGTRESRDEDVKLHSGCDMSREEFLAKDELFDLSINLKDCSVTPVD